MDKLAVSKSHVDGHPVLRLVGALTMLTSAQFDQDVYTELAEFDNVEVVLDVSELKFIDSSGLGSLVRLIQHVKSKDGSIHLAGMRANLLELIYISRLEREFKWYKSVEEAVAALKLAAVEEPAETGEADDGPTDLIEYQQSWVPKLPRAEATHEDKYHSLPEYEGCANYPTWYILQWFRSRREMRRNAIKIIADAPSNEEVGSALHRMVIHEHREVIHQRTLVNGMFGFAMRYVDWEEVAAQLKQMDIIE